LPAQNANIDYILTHWPTLPDDEVIYECLRNYYKATTWTSAKCCACYSQLNHKFTMLDFNVQDIKDSPDLLNLNILQNYDTRFDEFFALLPPPFQGLMLDIYGIQYKNNKAEILHLCEDCVVSLYI
jgi:hypothetical protein